MSTPVSAPPWSDWLKSTTQTASMVRTLIQRHGPTPLPPPAPPWPSRRGRQHEHPSIRAALERLVSAYAECQGQHEEYWPDILDEPIADARAILARWGRPTAPPAPEAGKVKEAST